MPLGSETLELKSWELNSWEPTLPFKAFLTACHEETVFVWPLAYGSRSLMPLYRLVPLPFRGRDLLWPPLLLSALTVWGNHWVEPIRPVFKGSIWKNGPSPWEIWILKGHFEVKISSGSRIWPSNWILRIDNYEHWPCQDGVAFFCHFWSLGPGLLKSAE